LLRKVTHLIEGYRQVDWHEITLRIAAIYLREPGRIQRSRASSSGGWQGCIFEPLHTEQIRMSFTRRDVLAGAAAMVTAATARAAPAADDDPAVRSSSASGAGFSMPPAPAGPLMNTSRAFQVMEEEGIDALVLGQGVNFYHACGHRPVTTRMGHRPGSFAIVTRNESQPLSLVLASFTYYYQLADGLEAESYPIYLYTGPDPEDPDKALPVNVFPDRNEWPVDDVEGRRASLTSQAEAEHAAAPGLVPALTRALTDLGLAKGTIALDHFGVRELLGDSLPGASFRGASSALSRIRPVKSELEIDLMRRAAIMNAEAALAAAMTVRSGATYRDLREVFAIEAARRGNRSVFMVVDRVSSGHFDAPFRDGQSFLIDAVSEYQGYHGDYGRTVFIGEPARPMDLATKAIGRAWDEVRHALKPGMRFSEVSALGRQTLRKMGASYAVTFSPHSVGLYHTDHVDQAGAGFAWQDLVLEPGMILSVDCPLLEAGVGGSAHLEDLMLITESGSEPLNDVGDQVIVV
jgi:Xaa-Pro aminopeptidase